MDSKTEKARSENMKRIRSKDTKPEKMVRSLLFRLGYRFRLHRKDLPGRPDIVMPSRKIAIFVQGCFWHQHLNCTRAVLPKSHQDYWHVKLNKNIQRDIRTRDELTQLGWRVLWIWECALKNKESRASLPEEISKWIESAIQFGEIPNIN